VLENLNYKLGNNPPSKFLKSLKGPDVLALKADDPLPEDKSS